MLLLWWLLAPVLQMCVGVAPYRGHRRMALIVVLCPLVARGRGVGLGAARAEGHMVDVVRRSDRSHG